MVSRTSFSLVGITDYDEGTNLSRYLIGHGWQADRAMTPEEVLADLDEGGYGLVVLDEEMLCESVWSLPDYLEEIGSDTAVIVLTEPGSRLRGSLPGGIVSFVEHPYTYEALRLAIDRMVSGRYDEEECSPADDDFLLDEEDDLLGDSVCEEWAWQE
jgi:DNA-binding NtrC family response regulator